MIKVVHLISGLNIGGAEIMLCKLLSQIDRSQFQSVVISLGDNGSLGAQLNQMGVRVVSLNMSSVLSGLIGFWKLIRILNKERPHILQSWLYHSDLLGLVAAKINRVSVVCWNIRCSALVAGDFPLTTTIIQKMLAKLSRIPDVTIVNSIAGKTFHENIGFRPNRWEVIPNGFDIVEHSHGSLSKSRFCQTLGLGDDTVLVGLIARYHPMKNHKGFLEAVKLIQKFRPNVHYLLVGSGVDQSNKFLTNVIREYGLKQHVHLLGERKDISAINTAIDIAVSCSSYGEGFPNAIGEAMACGTPSVVTDVGDSKYIVGDTGKIVPSNDIPALANAIVELLQLSQIERWNLGQSARKRVISLFSIQGITKIYEKLYREVFFSKNRGTTCY